LEHLFAQFAKINRSGELLLAAELFELSTYSSASDSSQYVSTILATSVDATVLLQPDSSPRY
jgi:hypothetical protein